MTCLPTLSRHEPRPDTEGERAALRDAQERLQELGLYPQGEEWVDEIFGPKMEEGIQALQSKHGLQPSGTIDADTWSALYDEDTDDYGRLPFESEVSEDFLLEVQRIAQRLQIDAAWLMAIMAFETGGSFDPAQKNFAGSGATGLIQFMPPTARGLGTSTSALAQMSAVQQLSYVEKYFRPYAPRLRTLEDAYMAVLWPAAVGKPAGYVLFRRPSIAYRQNRGLDSNGNGEITKWEAAAKVRKTLERGLAQTKA